MDRLKDPDPETLEVLERLVRARHGTLAEHKAAMRQTTEKLEEARTREQETRTAWETAQAQLRAAQSEMDRAWEEFERASREFEPRMRQELIAALRKLREPK
jgi:chromosome segregation ATPase